MGIDIYARWEGQLPSEVGKQFEVWLSGVEGRVGYLREAYHGEPYATEHLVPEAFEDAKGAQIPAKVLRERLLLTRNLEDKELFITRCRDTSNDERGFIIPLDDDDLEILTVEQQNPQFQFTNSLLKQRFDRLIM